MDVYHKYKDNRDYDVIKSFKPKQVTAQVRTDETFNLHIFDIQDQDTEVSMADVRFIGCQGKNPKLIQVGLFKKKFSKKLKKFMYKKVSIEQATETDHKYVIQPKTAKSVLSKSKYSLAIGQNLPKKFTVEGEVELEGDFPVLVVYGNELNTDNHLEMKNKLALEVQRHEQSTRSKRSTEGDVEKVEKKKRRRKHRNRKKSNKEVSSDVTVLSETADSDVTIQQGCGLKSKMVSFGEIGWDQWIVAPTGYQMSYCEGSCQFGTTTSVMTNHAIIQSLFSNVVRGIPQPCCTADVMETMTLLLLDTDGNVSLRSYPDINTTSCKCR